MKPAQQASDAVALARTRSRRRLVGALVLLGIGIVAFPLVFETQPRPVAVNIPIEIPKRENAAPLTPPAAPPAAQASVPAPAEAPVAREAMPAPVAAAPAPAAPPAASRVAEAKPAPRPEPKAPPAPPAPPAPQAASDAGRFIVQVGAFADAAAARETRQKVEKLGLKTYTQVAETASGNRTRVRIGPFASREEAEKALSRAKAAGIDGVVLTL